MNPMFNENHGALIPKMQKQLTIDEMLSINHRFMGGGMSQNYAALFFFEYFIRDNEIRFMLEIGTQKGALSLYLANMAGVTEQFIFWTCDISTADFMNREIEGTAHWFRDIDNLRPDLIRFICTDCFNPEFISEVKFMVSQYKTLIFCDGGNKRKELDVFGGLLKPQDLIVVHDWGMEIYGPESAEIMGRHNLEYYKPYSDWAIQLRTLLMPFKKK
jgi:cephalosporin hydroxylase